MKTGQPQCSTKIFLSLVWDLPKLIWTLCQIGRWVNIENALSRTCCSFPILSHSWPGEPQLANDHLTFLQVEQIRIVNQSFKKCAQTISFNTTVAQNNTLPHIQIPETMLSCITHWHLHAWVKTWKYYPSHGNSAHQWLVKDRGGKSVWSWWKQELSPPHRRYQERLA